MCGRAGTQGGAPAHPRGIEHVNHKACLLPCRDNAQRNMARPAAVEIRDARRPAVPSDAHLLRATVAIAPPRRIHEIGRRCGEWFRTVLPQGANPHINAQVPPFLGRGGSERLRRRRNRSCDGSPSGGTGEQGSGWNALRPAPIACPGTGTRRTHAHLPRPVRE